MEHPGWQDLVERMNALGERLERVSALASAASARVDAMEAKIEGGAPVKTGSYIAAGQGCAMSTHVAHHSCNAVEGERSIPKSGSKGSTGSVRDGGFANPSAVAEAGFSVRSGADHDSETIVSDWMVAAEKRIVGALRVEVQEAIASVQVELNQFLRRKRMGDDVFPKELAPPEHSEVSTKDDELHGYPSEHVHTPPSECSDDRIECESAQLNSNIEGLQTAPETPQSFRTTNFPRFGAGSLWAAGAPRFDSSQDAAFGIDGSLNEQTTRQSPHRLQQLTCRSAEMARRAAASAVVAAISSAAPASGIGGSSAASSLGSGGDSCKSSVFGRPARATCNLHAGAEDSQQGTEPSSPEGRAPSPAAAALAAATAGVLPRTLSRGTTTSELRQCSGALSPSTPVKAMNVHVAPPAAHPLPGSTMPASCSVAPPRASCGGATPPAAAIRATTPPPFPLPASALSSSPTRRQVSPAFAGSSVAAPPAHAKAYPQHGQASCTARSPSGSSPQSWRPHATLGASVSVAAIGKGLNSVPAPCPSSHPSGGNIYASGGMGAGGHPASQRCSTANVVGRPSNGGGSLTLGPAVTPHHQNRYGTGQSTPGCRAPSVPPAATGLPTVAERTGSRQRSQSPVIPTHPAFVNPFGSG